MYEIPPPGHETDEGARWSDRELVEALRAGGDAPWAELVRRCAPVVLAAVRRTLRAYRRGVSDADVEDLVAEIFAGFVRTRAQWLNTIGEPYDLKAWFAVAARRRTLNELRKRTPHPLSLDAPTPAGNPYGDGVPSPPPGLSEGDLGERRLRLARAMVHLGARERLLVQLFYLDGKKYREIAEITGTSINSIGPTLLRAVSKLKQDVEVA